MRIVRAQSARKHRRRGDVVRFIGLTATGRAMYAWSPGALRLVMTPHGPRLVNRVGASNRPCDTTGTVRTMQDLPRSVLWGTNPSTILKDAHDEDV